MVRGVFSLSALAAIGSAVESEDSHGRDGND
jgi:hypothetical protein